MARSQIQIRRQPFFHLYGHTFLDGHTGLRKDQGRRRAREDRAHQDTSGDVRKAMNVGASHRPGDSGMPSGHAADRSIRPYFSCDYELARGRASRGHMSATDRRRLCQGHRARPLGCEAGCGVCLPELFARNTHARPKSRELPSPTIPGHRPRVEASRAKPESWVDRFSRRAAGVYHNTRRSRRGRPSSEVRKMHPDDRVLRIFTSRRAIWASRRGRPRMERSRLRLLGPWYRIGPSTGCAARDFVFPTTPSLHPAREGKYGQRKVPLGTMQRSCDGTPATSPPSIGWHGPPAGGIHFLGAEFYRRA